MGPPPKETGKKKDTQKSFADQLGGDDCKGMTDRERRQKLKMMMINKRLDDLIEVLD